MKCSLDRNNSQKEDHLDRPSNITTSTTKGKERKGKGILNFLSIYLSISSLWAVCILKHLYHGLSTVSSRLGLFVGHLFLVCVYPLACSSDQTGLALALSFAYHACGVWVKRYGIGYAMGYPYLSDHYPLSMQNLTHIYLNVYRD